MKKVITRDGSVTFFHEVLGECYHSRSGALREAREKFALPSNVVEVAGAGKVVILDVCFGLGYNTAAAIDLILRTNPDCLVDVYGLESDPEILKKTYEIEPELDSYHLVRKAAECLEVSEGSIRIRIISGDARETIQQVPAPVDAVLFDPFSPQKVPDMWSEEFFGEIHRKMRPGARLVTYSCAGLVRRALQAAEFEVHDGPQVGRWSPSTVAIKH